MKLRRRKPDTSRLRQRHLIPDENLQKPSGYSYRARRSDEEINVGRRAERKSLLSPKLYSTRFWLQRSGLIVLLIAILASAINILNLSPTATIMPVISKNSTGLVFNRAAYAAAADRLLAGSLWNHNKVTIDTGQITRQLLAQFPELASVSVTVPLLTHHPIIYIEPAQAALIIKSSSASNSFVLNANGRALVTATTNPLVPGQQALPVVTDLSGLKLVLGHQILSANTVSFVQTIVAQLTAKGYMVSSMTLPPAASELDVTLTGKAYKIKFNLESNDPRQQVGTYLAMITQLQSQGITPAQYVDVRVDGRAFYQ
jgi:hypothetical protein